MKPPVDYAEALKRAALPASRHISPVGRSSSAGRLAAPIGVRATRRLYSTDAEQQKLINNKINLMMRWNNNNKPDPKGQIRDRIAPYIWFGDQTKTLGYPIDLAAQNPICANETCASESYYSAKSCDGKNTITKQFFCPADSGRQQRVGPHFAKKIGNYKVPDGMFSIHNTNFVQQVYALGYKGYTWQFDDGVGLLNCPSIAKINDPAKYTTYTITACPSGGTRNPGEPTEWVFSRGCGRAVWPQPKAGANPNIGHCSRVSGANMRYVCDDLTKFDPYDVPDALWRADPQSDPG